MNGGTDMAPDAPVWVRLFFGRNPKLTLIRLICLVATSFLVFGFVLIPIRVSGLSMYPTYKDGKINFVNQLAYRWKKPARGDVVAVRQLRDNRAVLLKRIVGLPGERVRVDGGRVYINGNLLNEPYARVKDGLSKEEMTLEDDQYFVVGDNRHISILGPVYEHYIIGKVLF
jgi:signal peptidase I